MKNLLLPLILSPLLFLLPVSCKSRNGFGSVEAVPAVESSPAVEIIQQSVVDTSFEGSFLYGPFRDVRIEGPLIPGLLNPLVPQGMAFWEEQDWMIISNYRSDDSAGVLTILNMEDGSFIKHLSLYNEDGTPHKGHLGGLALSREFLWIASGTGVYFIKREALLSAETKEKIILSRLIETETKGSFATFSEGILWIGEFTRRDGSYASAEPHHSISRDGTSHRAWLAGYKLSPETDNLNSSNIPSSKLFPDFILSIPDEIQGALITDDKIFLSASYGRKNYSRLLVFDNPMKGASHSSEEYKAFFPDRDVPFWYLDDVNKKSRMVLPPMSEALVLYEDSVAVLFESAASKYRDTAQFPLDRIQLLPLNAFE